MQLQWNRINNACNIAGEFLVVLCAIVGLILSCVVLILAMIYYFDVWMNVIIFSTLFVFVIFLVSYAMTDNEGPY